MANHPYNEEQDKNRRYAPHYQGNYSANAQKGQYHRGDSVFQFPWWVILTGFLTGLWPLAIAAIVYNSLASDGKLDKYIKNPRTNSGHVYGQGRSASATAEQEREQPVYDAEFHRAPAHAESTVQQELDAAKREIQAAMQEIEAELGGKSKSKKGKKKAKPAAQAPGDTGEKDQALRISTVLTIVGIIFAAIGAVVMAENMAYIISSLAGGYSYWYYLEDLMIALIGMGTGVGFVIGGQAIKTSWRMRRKISKIVGNADTAYIEDIAAAIPCSYEKCCKHLENCIDKGVFGDDAYLDMRTRCLVVRGSAPAPQPAPASAPKTETPVQDKQNSEYHQILQQLHLVNGAIDDPKMTQQITRLESVSAKIFAEIEQSPEKRPQMRKFMDYYLPTSLKLLQTYADLDAQGIEGANISESKRRIEQAMGMVVTAFENQLDKLFQADAMDVSADINVMENMLRADGLTGDDPFHLGATPASPQGPKLEL